MLRYVPDVLIHRQSCLLTVVIACRRRSQDGKAEAVQDHTYQD